MKLILLACVGVLVPSLLAQDDLPFTEAVASQPLKDWQLNLTTLGIVWFFVRRAYTNLRAGGGFYGVWRGIVYGDKTPDAKAKDDAHMEKAIEARRQTSAPFPPENP